MTSPPTPRYLKDAVRGVAWRVETDDFGEQGRPTYYCGDAGCVFAFCGLRLDPQPWPPALLAARRSVAAAVGVGAHALTGCLLNDYARGRGHIPWHSDEVRAHGFARTVASLSLGGPRGFRLRDRATLAVLREVDLPPGSVLCMDGDAQDRYEHELPLAGDAAPARTSCTFRSIVAGFEDAWDHIHGPRPAAAAAPQTAP